MFIFIYIPLNEVEVPNGVWDTPNGVWDAHTHAYIRITNL